MRQLERKNSQSHFYFQHIQPFWTKIATTPKTQLKIRTISFFFVFSFFFFSEFSNNKNIFWVVVIYWNVLNHKGLITMPDRHKIWKCRTLLYISSQKNVSDDLIWMFTPDCFLKWLTWLPPFWHWLLIFEFNCFFRVHLYFYRHNHLKCSWQRAQILSVGLLYYPLQRRLNMFHSANVVHVFTMLQNLLDFNKNWLEFEEKKW